MKAHEIRRLDYGGKVENLYTVRFDSYSDYTKNWSVVQIDIYAESEQDIMDWANDLIKKDMEEYKKEKIKNKIVFHSYERIKSIPFPDEYATQEEIENELMLEGCLFDD